MISLLLRFTPQSACFNASFNSIHATGLDGRLSHLCRFFKKMTPLIKRFQDGKIFSKNAVANAYSPCNAVVNNLTLTSKHLKTVGTIGYSVEPNGSIFTIEPIRPDRCTKMVYFVLSSVNNRSQRDVIRSTWASGNVKSAVSCCSKLQYFCSKTMTQYL